MKISDTTIQKIKELPVDEIVRHYVELKRKGSGFVGSCPFHEEKTGSFFVHPAKGLYKCFGCGASGDGIQFIRDYEKKTFIEAVELIAGLCRIDIEVDALKETKRTEKTKDNKIKKTIQTEIDTIHDSLIEGRLANYLDNPLTRLYADVFGSEIIREVIKLYNVSVNNSWLTFPQIDSKGRYRTAKGIKYKSDAHRDSLVNPYWLHNSLIKKGLLPETFRLKQCFTGEHILSKNRSKTIAIVEGQSTMLFMACLSLAAERYNIDSLSYFKDFVFISTGGADGIGWKNKCVVSVLYGVSVLLFPDAGFHEQWSNDAEEMKDYGINVAVSDFIEDKYKIGELKYNDDLRDYFMQYVEDIKSICIQKEIQVQLNEIASVLPGVLKTGKDFGNLTFGTIQLKNGQLYEILFDKEGQIITKHEKLKEAENFFNKRFIKGMIDDTACLFNIPLN